MSVDDSPISVSSPVSVLNGIGNIRVKQLRRLGINSLADLIRHFPVRYEQDQGDVAIAELQDGTEATVRGTVARTRWHGGGGRGRGKSKGRFEVIVEDESSSLILTFFNARWMTEKVMPGHLVEVHGKVGRYMGARQMTNPMLKHLRSLDELPQNGLQDRENSGRLRPVYPATEGLRVERIEQLISQTLKLLDGRIADAVPTELLQSHQLPVLAESYRWIHAPENLSQATLARKRFAWNELLLLQLAVAMRRHRICEQHSAPSLQINKSQHKQLLDALPFKLTDSQQRVSNEVLSDLSAARPMNRLVQGDVGSGKTVIALQAMVAAALNGKQALLMAPTQVLAQQHYQTLSNMLAPMGMKIELLLSQQMMGVRKRRELEAAIVDGSCRLVVGTQALLNQDINFPELGVVVIDEQHRFGVLQRSAFRDFERTDASGKPIIPHHLVMTATPIPRTLAVTLFGDLDISTIDQLPPGRQTVQTRLLSPERHDEVYQFVRQRAEKDERIFVVVPAIGDNTDTENESTLRAVEKFADELEQGHLKGVGVARMHSRMKKEEREAEMQAFRNGSKPVLVSTTVIEVGVDVPEATVMVIEEADRFGLAQLHQLRGRVGRAPGYSTPCCLLVSASQEENSQDRLQVLINHADGFDVAQKDFEQRGMGHVLGTQQSGFSSFEVARFPEDAQLVVWARNDAQSIISGDPELAADRWQRLRSVLMRQHGETLGLADVG